MMGKRIITISREFGSGGRFIGMEVAQKLGVKMRNCHPRRGYLPMRFQGATRWDDPLKT